MAKTSWKDATHAVVGSSREHGVGTIDLRDNEFEAHQVKREVRQEPDGWAEVFEVHDGGLPSEGEEILEVALDGFFGR